jgi:hypothetical protein
VKVVPPFTSIIGLDDLEDDAFEDGVRILKERGFKYSAVYSCCHHDLDRERSDGQIGCCIILILPDPNIFDLFVNIFG